MKKLLIALVLVASASVGAQEIKTQEDDLASEIGRVDLKSGIEREQARAVAEYYGQRFIAGCGSVDAAVDRNVNWEIVPRIGVAGDPDKDAIFIGKHTGRVSWGSGPVLNLTDIVEAKEAAPEPINRDEVELKRLSRDALDSTVRIRFVVLPSGITADFSFKSSSKNRVCDSAARRVVEGWRFPPRKQPITLVASVKTCSH